MYVLAYLGGIAILTLPAINERGFFLQPARLPVVLLERRVEAVCPEAFSGEPEVSLCPRVPTAFAKMFNAALWSLSSTTPHPVQTWVRMLRLFLTTVPHAEQF